MNKVFSILLLPFVWCCNNPQTAEQIGFEKLEHELAIRDTIIAKLQEQLSKQESDVQPKFWYAFEPTTEHNIVKLWNGDSKQIDHIDLIDSVDVVYTFEHKTTISQLKDPNLDNFLSNFSEVKEVLYMSTDYGPMADNLSFFVRAFVICEESGLPIETENCTDNIYILVQPTELGFENNLFKISRLFRSEIKSLENTVNGVILTLEHSRYPRKELKILIKPQLVKFLK